MPKWAYLSLFILYWAAIALIVAELSRIPRFFLRRFRTKMYRRWTDDERLRIPWWARVLWPKCHSCWYWDGLVIDGSDPEMEFCHCWETCAPPMPDEVRRRDSPEGQEGRTE